MIIIEKSHAESIKQVCQSAATRATIQAFENVLIRTLDGAVELKAGDSLIELTKIIPCEVKSGFETTVNAPKFLQAFNSCDGDVSVTVKEKMTIKSGKRRFTLPVIPAESYPAYPEMSDEQIIDCDNLVDIVKCVSWASGVDDARHMLNGVFIGDHAVGTNGHKMCVAELGCSANIIIPIASVKRMPTFDGDIYISDSIMCIRGEDSVFKTKLIDGRYPDYKRAIPSPVRTVSVNLSEFKDAVKAAQVTANSQFKTVVIEFGENSLIKATSSDRREDSSIGFDCDASENFTFSLNSSYLIEALNAVESDVVNMGFTDGQMIIESNGIKSIISSVKV